MSDSTYILRYFDARGRAEPIRLIFAHAGVNYEDVRIAPAEWPRLKKNYPYGKLPTLEIDGKVVSQSAGIARYLARQFDLAGDNDWEALQCDEIAGAVEDIAQGVYDFIKETDAEKKKSIEKAALDRLALYLGNFEKATRTNGGFVVGSKLTWADLYVIVFCDDLFRWFGAQVLDKYPGVKALNERVNAIPRIAAWIKNRPATDF